MSRPKDIQEAYDNDWEFEEFDNGEVKIVKTETCIG
jgi:hypothetical protein